MKNVLTTMTALLIIVLMLSGFELRAQKPKDKEVVKIQTNLDCESCKKKIENYMAFEKGVTAVSAEVQTKIVTIEYRTKRTSEEKLVEAIKKLGYKAEVIEEKPADQ